MSSNTPNPNEVASCANCWKPVSFCVCTSITPRASKLRWLILQHPRESKAPLSTARLLSLAVPNAKHRVGLSWRSLSHALGEQREPSKWAVLFLGGLKESASVLDNMEPDEAMRVVNKFGKKVALNTIEGIVILDGNWKQSKTLWWRNPWLLKLHRGLLNPANSSRYGAVRKQPRKGCLSTLEAAAETLGAFRDPQGAEGLQMLFSTFLDTAQAASKAKRPAKHSYTPKKTTVPPELLTAPVLA